MIFIGLGSSFDTFTSESSYLLELYSGDLEVSPSFFSSDFLTGEAISLALISASLPKTVEAKESSFFSIAISSAMTGPFEIKNKITSESYKRTLSVSWTSSFLSLSMLSIILNTFWFKISLHLKYSKISNISVKKPESAIAWLISLGNPQNTLDAFSKNSIII